VLPRADSCRPSVPPDPSVPPVPCVSPVPDRTARSNSKYAASRLSSLRTAESGRLAPQRCDERRPQKAPTEHALSRRLVHRIRTRKDFAMAHNLIWGSDSSLLVKAITWRHAVLSVGIVGTDRQDESKGLSSLFELTETQQRPAKPSLVVQLTRILFDQLAIAYDPAPLCRSSAAIRAAWGSCPGRHRARKASASAPGRSNASPAAQRVR
jgi:hypothetical protein